MKYSYISKYASPTSIVKLAFSNLFNLIPIDKEKIVADALITALADAIMNLKVYATKSLTPLEYLKGMVTLTRPSLLHSGEYELEGVIGARMFFQGNILHTDMAKKLLKAVKNYGNQADLLTALKSDLSTDAGKNELMKEIQNQIIGFEEEDEDDSWDESEEGFFDDEKIEDFIDKVFQSNIDLRKENIDNIPGEGQLVIDEQKIDQTHLEKIVMSFEVNRLNVGIEMCCQYNLKAHRYTDENA